MMLFGVGQCAPAMAELYSGGDNAVFFRIDPATANSTVIGVTGHSMDALTFDVPGPSSLVLLSMAAFGLLIWRKGVGILFVHR